MGAAGTGQHPEQRRTHHGADPAYEALRQEFASRAWPRMVLMTQRFTAARRCVFVSHTSENLCDSSVAQLINMSALPKAAAHAATVTACTRAVLVQGALPLHKVLMRLSSSPVPGPVLAPVMVEAAG